MITYRAAFVKRYFLYFGRRNFRLQFARACVIIALGEFGTILTHAARPKKQNYGVEKMKNKSVRYLVTAALTAALYAALTMVLWEISSAGIQFRLSEALCVLPAFTPAAIPGLTIGCAVANILGGTWIDVVFGSLATLLAAIASYFIGRAFRVGRTERVALGAKLLVPLPPVVFNALIIPFVLYYGYGVTATLGATSKFAVLGLHALTVGAGEAAVCYVLGVSLMLLLNRINRRTELF